MTKQEFTKKLSMRLSSLSRSEVEKTITYYEEIIEDRIEEGMSEEEAVGAFGDMDEIVEIIMRDMPLQVLVKAKVNDSKERAGNKTVWSVLAILGFPIWGSLLLAFLGVILSLYCVVWALIFSIYSLVVAFGFTGVAGILAGIIFSFTVSVPTGMCVLGLGICFISLVLFLIKPINAISKQLIMLTADAMRKIKSWFMIKNGEEARERT